MRWGVERDRNDSSDAKGCGRRREGDRLVGWIDWPRAEADDPKVRLADGFEAESEL